MEEIQFNIRQGPVQDFDTLHINRYINAYRFIDRDTKQFVIYLPSVEISGYGETSEKAGEMVKESLSDLFASFLKMSLSELDNELRRLGWKKDKFRNKEFSNPLINIQGKLKELNADNDNVERLALVA